MRRLTSFHNYSCRSDTSMRAFLFTAVSVTLFLAPTLAYAQTSSLALDGASFAIVDDAPALDLQYPLTIEAWVKRGAGGSENAILLEKDDYYSYMFQFVGSGAEAPLKVKVYNSFTSNSGIRAGEWTHLAVTYDGTLASLYINGILDATKAITSQPKTNSQPLRFGTNIAANGNYFQGEIDEVRIWNVSRYSFEIQNTMFDTLAGNEAGLVAYYKFNEGSGTTFSDASPNVNTGTIYNKASFVIPGIFPIPPDLFGVPGNGSVELTWRERKDTEGTANQFKVYYSTIADLSDRQLLTSVGADINTYSDQNLTNGATYFYQTTVVDADAHESDYSQPIAVTPRTPFGGNSLSLSGDNAFAIVADCNSLDLQYPLTIEAWVKRGAGGSENAILFEKGDYYSYMFQFVGSGEEAPLKVKLYTDFTSNSGIRAGEWTHLAVTYDGTQASLYINGVLDATKAITSQLKTNSQPLRFGTNIAENDNFFQGEIDELRIWNVARSKADLEQNFLNPIVGNEAGLVAYWRFNETGGSVAYSAALGPHKVELTGNAVFAESGFFPIQPRAYAVPSNKSVKLIWSERSNAEGRAGQFKIYRSNNADLSDRQLISTSVSSDTAYIDRNLTNDTTYFYQNTVVDADSNESDYSYPVAVMPQSNTAGNALSLSGDNSFALTEDKNSLDLQYPLTIEAWVKRGPGGSENAILFEKGDYYSYMFQFVGSGAEVPLKVKLYSSFTSNTGILAGEWTHLAVTHDGTLASLYINGVLDATKAMTSQLKTNSHPLRFGTGIGENDNFFQGEIDDVRIWNVVQSIENINDNMSLNLMGNEAGLLYYWRFNNPSGNVTYSSASRPSKIITTNANFVTSDLDLQTVILEVKGYENNVPETFTLQQNYPNPFNPVSTIQYDLPKGSEVSLIVYDILGREVVRLVDRDMTAGYHQAIWDGRTASGREVPTGLYIARLITPEYTRSIKMLLLR